MLFNLMAFCVIHTHCTRWKLSDWRNEPSVMKNPSVWNKFDVRKNDGDVFFPLPSCCVLSSGRLGASWNFSSSSIDCWRAEYMRFFMIAKLKYILTIESLRSVHYFSLSSISCPCFRWIQLGTNRFLLYAYVSVLVCQRWVRERWKKMN